MLGGALSIARFVLGHPVGRRRPLRCRADTLAWQLRAASRPRIVPFAGEAKLWARRGETGVTGNVYVGLHECAEMAFLAHLLRPGELFVDVGANAGSYTVLAAKISGARVVAVEPVPETADRLEANVALNAVGDRVSVYRTAISDRAGRVWFTSGRDTTNRIAGSADPREGLVEVPCTTLDDLLGGARPRALKIDVEGYEAAVLRGATELLAIGDVLALVVEMAEPKGEAADLLARHGYAPARYEPFARRLEPQPADGLGGSGNVIWLQDRAEAERRVRTAPAISVKGLWI